MQLMTRLTAPDTPVTGWVALSRPSPDLFLCAPREARAATRSVLGFRRGAPWVGILSALGLVAALSAAALRLESVEEGVEAGGEPFVAVVEPDVFGEGDEGGEAVGR